MIEGAIDGFSESEVYDDFWSENAPTVQSFETNCNFGDVVQKATISLKPTAL
jgi:hypothetical protein